MLPAYRSIEKWVKSPIRLVERHGKLYYLKMAPRLTDMSTWTGRTGHDGLRSFTDEDGNFWLEQNAHKTSKWAKFAKKGHDVAWEFGANRRYTGRMLVDGEILTPGEATTKFFFGSR